MLCVPFFGPHKSQTGNETAHTSKGKWNKEQHTCWKSNGTRNRKNFQSRTQHKTQTSKDERNTKWHRRLKLNGTGNTNASTPYRVREPASNQYIKCNKSMRQTRIPMHRTLIPMRQTLETRAPGSGTFRDGRGRPKTSTSYIKSFDPPLKMSLHFPSLSQLTSYQLAGLAQHCPQLP